MSTGWSERQGRIRTGVISALAGLMLVSGTPAFSAGEATETVPLGFGYAGRLRRDGALFTGQTVWRLAIVDAAGRVLWTNDGSGQIPPVAGVAREVAGGVVNLAVGQPQVVGEAMQPVPSAVFAAPRTYLRAWVAAPTTAQSEELIAGEQPVPHAQAFQSVPYSHRAAEAGRAESAGRADVASGLAPLAVGQPVEVQGDLRVHGRVLDADGRDLARVGAASTPPDEDDHGKRGRVTFDTVTTRHLIVTESVSLPGGGVFTSTVTQVQTLVVQTTATFQGPVAAVGGVKVGTGTIVLGAVSGTLGAPDTILLRASDPGPGTGVVASGGTNWLSLQGGQPIANVSASEIRLAPDDNNVSPRQLQTIALRGNTILNGRVRVTGGAIPFPLTSVTSPNSMLDLTADGGANIARFRASDESTRFLITALGDVGIGTASPGAKLHVASPPGAPQIALTNTGVLTVWQVQSHSPGGGLPERLSISDLPSFTERLTILPGSVAGAGNVGIGVANPMARLDIQQADDTLASSALRVRTGTTPTTKFVVNGAGDVGVGTAVPGARLDVVGALRVQRTAGRDSGVFIVTQAGQVGIGQGSPTTDLDIASGLDNGPSIRLRNTTNGGDWSLGLDGGDNIFSINEGVSSRLVIRRGTGEVGIGAAGSAAAGVKLNVTQDDDTSATTALQVRTGSPGTTKFSVDGAGNVRAHGTIAANSIDVAERFEITGNASPGDALIADPVNPGKLTLSTKPRDPAFAGVYSTKPGLLLGNEIPGPPIGIVGRLLAKVSAENGPVHPGTPLTTASTPGHLMAADAKTPAAAIVGISLGTLESGTGLVQVLLK